MRVVAADKFENVKSALLECISTNTNQRGLRIVPPSLTENQLENAATLALMALSCDWVRPSNVEFLDNPPRRS